MPSNSVPTGVPAADIVGASFAQIQKRYESRGAIDGLSTGFSQLDAMTSGLQATDLIIVAGRPSMGKSALCMSMAMHSAINLKLPTLYFSLVESKEHLVQRLLVCLARVDSNRLRTGIMHADDWKNMESARKKIEESRLVIDDMPVRSVLDIQKRCSSAKDKYSDISLVVVDHIQGIGSNREFGSTPRIQVETAAGLKRIAVELNVPLIATSQLPRAVEERRNKRPYLGDLEGAEAADVVIYLYRDEYYNPDSKYRGIAELLIARQRNGPIGTVDLAFQSSCSRFYDKGRDDLD
jgi:replicative DNA helicase